VSRLQEEKETIPMNRTTLATNKLKLTTESLRKLRVSTHLKTGIFSGFCQGSFDSCGHHCTQ
jgi:hypothetical protein